MIRSLKDKLMYRAWMKTLPLLCKGNWFDITILWRKQLLHKAGQLVQAHGIRQVIVTGAPFRLMAYGAELKKQFPQINLVLDFRDEWTWKDHYGLASIGAKRLAFEKELEALAIGAADRIISPDGTILQHLAAAYPHHKSQYVQVPHAVDPDDFDPSLHAEADGIFRIVYAGSMYGASEAEHYFDQVISSLENLRTQHPVAFSHYRMDLYITGHNTDQYKRKVDAHHLEERIRFHAPIPPQAAFKEVREANLVVLFIPSGNRDILGTKFQEIFYAGTPILHIGEPGLVSRTIEARRMGASIRVEEVEAELPKIIRGERVIEVDKHADHSEYLLPNVTDRLIAEVLA